jgi:PAS domain S-box-containing protein
MQSPHCSADPAALPGHLTQVEADYSRLFNLSLDLLCIAGLDGYFKQVNPSWTRVLGWSREELLARPVADFMHPEDRERTLQAREVLA